jgi:hypothetical protein
MMLPCQYSYQASGAQSLRVEVSDNVGGLLPQLGVNVTGEGVGKGGSDEDIGKGDSLADNVGSVKEDLVEGLQTGLELVDGSGVGLLVSLISKDKVADVRAWCKGFGWRRGGMQRCA